MKKRPANLSSSTQQEKNESKKDVLTNLLQQTLEDVQPSAGGDLSHVEHSSQRIDKANNQGTSTSTMRTSKPIDLSPLVSELISNNPFDFDKKQFEDVSDLVQSTDGGDLFVGEFPVLDLARELSNVSETIKSDAKNIGSTNTMEEDKIIKQFSPVEKQVGVASSSLEELLDGNKPRGGVDPSTKEEQQECDDKKDSQDKHTSCDMNKDVNASEHLQDKLASSRSNKVGDEKQGEPTASNENVGLKEKTEDDIVETMKTVETIDDQKLIKDSKQEIRTLSELRNISVSSTTGVMSEKSQNSEVTENEATNVNTSSADASENKEKPDIFWNTLESVEKHSTKQTEAEAKEKKDDTGPDRGNKESLNKAAVVVKEYSQTPETQVTQEQLNKNEGRQENTEEPSSGSEVGSPEANLVRTSNRKRKAPPPRDLSVHPPGWVRSALQ